MGHVYAHLDEFKQYATGGDFGNDRNAAVLTLLGSASRAVDGYCRRGSGFGPENKVLRLVSAGRRLRLGADVLAVLEVSIDGTVIDEDRYELVEPRVLEGPWGMGRRVQVTARVGYAEETEEIGALADAADETDEQIALDTDVSPGMTLLIDDEQMLVTAFADGTATVQRGQNGTTSEAHDYASAVSVYRYAAEAVDGTLRVAHRRWKMRDAGVTGTFDGLGMPATQHGDTEVSILRMAVGHLRFAVVG